MYDPQDESGYLAAMDAAYNAIASAEMEAMYERDMAEQYQRDAVDGLVAGLTFLAAPICTRCDEHHDRIRLATTEEGYCADCYDAVAEGQWDAFCEDFYGGSTPQTDAERAEVERLQGVR